MPVATVPSSTGPAVFPDLGILAYNGIRFSTLYTSKLTSAIIQDNAKRTTKGVEWTLVVNGLVTLDDGATTTDASFAKLRALLSVQGAPLNYSGKGFGDLIVNQTQGRNDMAWGPNPKVIAFQPLGGSRSAFITWQMTALIPEYKVVTGEAGAMTNPVVQYNYEAVVSYDDEGYSNLSLRGTLEIPMTRPNVTDRALPDNVDNYRQQWLNISFDLTKFRVTRRNFQISRDKRTIEWEFAAEEVPPMGLPAGATKARGTYSVRPMRSVAVTGGRLPVLNGAAWSCTLRCTYTISKNYPRRAAALAFYSLLAYRLRSSVRGVMPTGRAPNPPAPAPSGPPASPIPRIIGGTIGNIARFYFGANTAVTRGGVGTVTPGATTNGQTNRAQLMDLSLDEGLYLDSRTMTWEASWWVVTTFETLLTASGVWRWDKNSVGGNIAVASLASISGWRSWLENKQNTTADIIIDLGFKPGFTAG